MPDPAAHSLLGGANLAPDDPKIKRCETVSSQIGRGT